MKTSDSKKTFTEEIKGSASEAIKQIRKLIKEGNARRLMIKDKKGKVLFQTQLTAGLAGSALISVMAPIASAIGMFALFMNDIKIIVEKYPADEMGEDEYEVDAEEAEVIVDIEDDEEEGSPTPEASETKEPKEEKTDKTVGKNKKSDEE